MTRIEQVDVTDVGAEARLHVMPGGHMLCSVAGVDLHPTPGWLCRIVALRTAMNNTNQEASAHATEESLYREGLKMLHEVAPVVIDLPYEVLHGREEGAS